MIKKLTTIVVLIASSLCYQANANNHSSSQRVGNMIYHNFSNGQFGSSQRVGNMMYHNFSNGRFGSSRKVGNMIYNTFNW